MIELEDTACYAGLLLAPEEGFGFWPRVVLPFGQKKLIVLFGPIVCHFWFPVVTLLIFEKIQTESVFLYGFPKFNSALPYTWLCLERRFQ